MSCLIAIGDDINWRMSELGSLKSIPLRYRLLDHHREMIIKYTIPSIYSLWEGFVRNSFQCYSREINSLELHITEIHINLIAYSLTSIDKLRLENPRYSFKSKRDFTEAYFLTISNSFKISEEIPTRSNVNFETINEILHIFNLEPLPKDFERKLMKLVRFRNSIAHGEVKIPIQLADIEFFAQLLNDLMIEIVIRIESGLIKKTYQKKL